jgi:hypothetical protein
MTRESYLNCTKIKQGYFRKKDVVEWITEQLLPAIAVRYGEGVSKMIVLDNVLVYIANEVTKPIIAASYIIKYLPPYSPDFNPIEMTLAVLKARIRQNY